MFSVFLVSLVELLLVSVKKNACLCYMFMLKGKYLLNILSSHISALNSLVHISALCQTCGSSPMGCMTEYMN